MHKYALAFGLVAAIATAGAALAEATRPLDAISACRLDDARIVLRFTFEGGACQQPGEATVERGKDGLGFVTVPTTNVGEVCAMQIVDVPFEAIVNAARAITTLDITVLRPEGGRQALGSTDIDTGSEVECVEPAPAPQ